jgi:hypothetical protein
MGIGMTSTFSMSPQSRRFTGRQSLTGCSRHFSPARHLDDRMRPGADANAAKPTDQPHCSFGFTIALMFRAAVGMFVF